MGSTQVIQRPTVLIGILWEVSCVSSHHQDDLKEVLRDGNITVQGTDDILTKALGTPEHSGRVRAAGKFHSISSYFNLPRRGSNKEKDELLRKKDELLMKKDEELREKNETCKGLKERVRDLELIIQQGMGSSPRLEKVSSNSGRSYNIRGATSQSQFQPKKSNESKGKDIVSKLTPARKENHVASKPSRKINIEMAKPLSIKKNRCNCWTRGHFYDHTIKDSRAAIVLSKTNSTSASARYCSCKKLLCSSNGIWNNKVFR